MPRVSPALMQHLGWHPEISMHDEPGAESQVSLLNVPWVVDKEIHDEWRETKRKGTGQGLRGLRGNKTLNTSFSAHSSSCRQLPEGSWVEPTEEARIKDSGGLSPLRVFGFFLTVHPLFVFDILNSVPRAFNNHNNTHS